jgi:hypothetical protein
MTRVDASFGPATSLGWPLERLPELTNLRVVSADRSEVTVSGSYRVGPNSSGVNHSPYLEGEWIPIEVTYQGRFYFSGKGHRRRLTGGIVYSTESWYNDEDWVETSGHAITLQDCVAASQNTGTMFAYEQRLLAGADMITGSDFGDCFSTFGGDDIVDGGEGSDTIFGGDGNDRITGGTGNNILRGDAGADVFSLTYGEGFDWIADYTPGVDRLDTSRLFSVTSRQVGSTLWVYAGNDVVAGLANTSAL